MLQERSVVAAFSSLVRLDIVNDLLYVLDSIGPDQVFFTILSLLIEQLSSLKLGLELLSVICCAQSDGKLLHLSFTLGEVLHEPDESLFSIRHRLKHALGSLGH